jgi:hypothetical protein
VITNLSDSVLLKKDPATLKAWLALVTEIVSAFENGRLRLLLEIKGSKRYVLINIMLVGK